MDFKNIEFIDGMINNIDRYDLQIKNYLTYSKQFKLLDEDLTNNILKKQNCNDHKLFKLHEHYLFTLTFKRLNYDEYLFLKDKFLIKINRYSLGSYNSGGTLLTTHCNKNDFDDLLQTNNDIFFQIKRDIYNLTDAKHFINKLTKIINNKFENKPLYSYFYTYEQQDFYIYKIIKDILSTDMRYVLINLKNNQLEWVSDLRLYKTLNDITKIKNSVNNFNTYFNKHTHK